MLDWNRRGIRVMVWVVLGAVFILAAEIAWDGVMMAAGR